LEGGTLRITKDRAGESSGVNLVMSTNAGGLARTPLEWDWTAVVGVLMDASIGYRESGLCIEFLVSFTRLVVPLAAIEAASPRSLYGYYQNDRMMTT
jgi:hypothetical protein